MENFAFHTHFDGAQILLDDPVELKPHTKLLISIVSPDNDERNAWLCLSGQRLEAVYGNDEPEYLLTSIKEHNPAYVRG